MTSDPDVKFYINPKPGAPEGSGLVEVWHVEKRMGQSVDGKNVANVLRQKCGVYGADPPSPELKS